MNLAYHNLRTWSNPAQSALTKFVTYTIWIIFQTCLLDIFSFTQENLGLTLTLPVAHTFFWHADSSKNLSYGP